MSKKDFRTRLERSVVFSGLSAGARRFLSSSPITTDYLIYPILPLAVPTLGFMLFQKTGVASPFTETVLTGLAAAGFAKYLGKEKWPMAALFGLTSAAAYVVAVRVVDEFWDGGSMF